MNKIASGAHLTAVEKTGISNSLTLRNILLATVALLTVFSIYALRFAYNAADLRNHAFGAIGTLLMLQTELSYTWRKKKLIKVGSAKTWLQLHIGTGLLGPALILYHANWQFSGFAGSTVCLMLLVTASGILGRYVYRAIPATLNDIARTLEELACEQEQLEKKLRIELADEPETLKELLGLEILTPKNRGLLGLINADLDYYDAKKKIHRRLRAFEHNALVAYRDLEELALNRLSLEKRVIVLTNSKNVLAKWRKIHRPLTLTLFYFIGLHIVTIFYYGKSFL